MLQVKNSVRNALEKMGFVFIVTTESIGAHCLKNTDQDKSIIQPDEMITFNFRVPAQFLKVAVKQLLSGEFRNGSFCIIEQ